MAEELALQLSEEEAASLYLLLEISNAALQDKLAILTEISLLPNKERPEELQDTETLNGVINLNRKLLADSKNMLEEVGQIVIELNKSQELIIKPPSSWSIKS